jgi:hypothetical protein
MENKSLSENLSILNDSVKKYLNARLELAKIKMMAKATRIGTYFFSTMVVLITLAFFFLFLAFAFSFWYAENFGNIYEGFLLSGGGFVVLGLIILLLRNQIFSNSIVRNIADILMSDEEND